MAGYVDVRAYAELNDFLEPESRGLTVRRPFRAHQTVKDVLEAMGIPHTEVDLILVNGNAEDFSHRPTAGDRIAAYPVFEALDIGSTARLRPVPLRHPCFVIDVNLGRLARLLRVLGFDVWWSSDEVIRQLDLQQRLAPFTRCVRCNGRLVAVTKDEVIDHLEPLTRRYYDDFSRCAECGRIYWPGSHHARLVGLVERLRGQL
jgi:uncharacterized protein with PIN domain